MTDGVSAVPSEVAIGRGHLAVIARLARLAGMLVVVSGCGSPDRSPGHLTHSQESLAG